jgi:drug/metabolite transporter (DMT)-like permease
MNSNTRSNQGLGAPFSDRGTLLAFLLLVLFAGGNAVAVRLSNSALPPFWGASLRFAAAGLVFWILVAVRGLALPKGRALLGAILYGLLSVGLAYAFLYWGLLRSPASLAGAVLAFVPLLTLLFAAAHGLEELRWRGVIGALMATAGVLIGVIGGFRSAVHVPSVLALVAGVACLAESTVLFKFLPQSDPLVTNALAIMAGTPLLAALSRFAGEAWNLPSSFRGWAAVAYLALIGTVAVFYLYLYVLSRWTASATSYSFLLIPVATVVIAALVLGEAITASFLIGAALVLVGVWFGAIQSPPKVVELTCRELPTRAVC